MFLLSNQSIILKCFGHYSAPVEKPTPFVVGSRGGGEGHVFPPMFGVRSVCSLNSSRDHGPLFVEVGPDAGILPRERERGRWKGVVDALWKIPSSKSLRYIIIESRVMAVPSKDYIKPDSAITLQDPIRLV